MDEKPLIRQPRIVEQVSTDLLFSRGELDGSGRSGCMDHNPHDATRQHHHHPLSGRPVHGRLPLISKSLDVLLLLPLSLCPSSLGKLLLVSTGLSIKRRSRWAAAVRQEGRVVSHCLWSAYCFTFKWTCYCLAHSSYRRGRRCPFSESAGPLEWMVAVASCRSPNC